MLTISKWIALVAVVTLAPSLYLAYYHNFFPTGEDLADPLGRPADLSLGLIDSAYNLDELATTLVPKHEKLSETIQTLNPVSADLADLTAEASSLSPLTETLNASTMGVQEIAVILPSKLDLLTSRSETVQPVVTGLSGAVGGVTGELEILDSQLATIGVSLSTLGPKADGIQATLATIEAEAAKVHFAGPLLALLGPMVNGPQAPAPGPEK